MRRESESFILGTLRNPIQLDDDSFAQAIEDIFYNLILKHAEYLYAEASDQVMARTFEENLRNLSENDFINLERWFCDPRFLSVLVLLQARYASAGLTVLVDKVSKSYQLSEIALTYLSTDIMTAHQQVWASLIGLESSLLNLIIKIRGEKRDSRSINKVQQLKESKKTAGDKQIGDSYLKCLADPNQFKLGDKTISQIQFAEKVIVEFLHRRINDTYLKTVDFCFYLTDQKSEYERKNKDGFSYVAFIYDILFENPGYLRSVQVIDIDSWLKSFFSTLWATLNDVVVLTKKQGADHKTFNELDSGFFSTKDNFEKTLNEVKDNEFNILGQARLAFLKIIVGRTPNNSDMTILRNENNCTEVLARIFAVPFKALLELKKSPNTNQQKAEEEIRNNFLNIKNLGVFWQKKILPRPPSSNSLSVSPTLSRYSSPGSTSSSVEGSPLKTSRENVFVRKHSSKLALNLTSSSRDDSPLKEEESKPALHLTSSSRDSSPVKEESRFTLRLTASSRESSPVKEEKEREDLPENNFK